MEAVKKRLGIYTAIALYSLYIVMFIMRLLGYPHAGHWLASVQFTAIVPLIFLLTRARQNKRPALNIIQITLMLAFLLIEFLIDYVYQIEFRQVQWMVITYVMIFFAATGGLLGLAFDAKEQSLRISALVLYLLMAILAYVQRAITGM